MNESCHIWMSHVTYEWIMSHMNESCHTWMSHVTYEWVMPHINEPCHAWMSHVTYEWVMSHMNESCHTWMSHMTYEWVMPHMNESCHTWMSHVTYRRVMSHIVTDINKLQDWCKQRDSAMCDMTHSHTSHVTYEWAMSHIHESYHMYTSHATHKGDTRMCQQADINKAKETPKQRCTHPYTHTHTYLLEYVRCNKAIVVCQQNGKGKKKRKIWERKEARLFAKKSWLPLCVKELWGGYD